MLVKNYRFTLGPLLYKVSYWMPLDPLKPFDNYDIICLLSY